MPDSSTYGRDTGSQDRSRRRSRSRCRSNSRHRSTSRHRSNSRSRAHSHTSDQSRHKHRSLSPAHWPLSAHGESTSSDKRYHRHRVPRSSSRHANYHHYSRPAPPRRPSDSSRRRDCSPVHDRLQPRCRSPSRDHSSRRRARSRSFDREPGKVSLHSELTVPSKRARRSSDYDRKMVLYGDSPEKRSTLPQKRMRDAFDEHDSIRKKATQEPKLPKVNVLLHKPVLSYDNQSEEGFMDLDALIATEAQKVAENSEDFRQTPNITDSNIMASLDPNTHVVYDDPWDDEPAFAPDPAFAPEPAHSEVSGIHPDRMRRLSYDVDDDDFTTSSGPAPFVPEGPNAFPIGSRKAKVQTSSFATSSQHLDSWGTNDAARTSSGVSYGPPSPPQLDPWNSTNESMAPPPVAAAPSMKVMSAPDPAPVPAPVDTRTRQQIFDDFVEQKEKIIEDDLKHRKANGTVAYEVSQEEIQVILARMTFNPGPIVLATQKWGIKEGKDAKFLINESDRRFIPTAPRLNAQGHPLTTYDEVTTFQKINDLAGKTIKAILAQKPGPKKIETKRQKADRLAEEKRAENLKLVAEEDQRKAKGKENAAQKRTVAKTPSSREDDALSASLEGLIDVDMVI